MCIHASSRWHRWQATSSEWLQTANKEHSRTTPEIAQMELFSDTESNGGHMNRDSEMLYGLEWEEWKGYVGKRTSRAIAQNQ